MGSNQCVYNSDNGKFISKAKKAYNKIKDLTIESDNANKVLRQVLGNSFPKAEGKTEKNAKELLTKDGLEVEIATEEDTTKENGIVLKQSIEAGKTVDEGTKIIITVNKIAEIKSGKLDINLKALTGGIKLGADGKEIDPEATLTVKVVSAGKEETVYNEKHRKDSESISFSITGVGTITVKVFVNDVKKAEKQMNLNSSETFWKVE